MMDIAQDLYDKYQPMLEKLTSFDNVYDYEYKINNEKSLTDKMFKYGESVLDNRVNLALIIFNTYNTFYLILFGLRIFFLEWETEWISAGCQFFLFGSYLYLLYKKRQYDKVKEQFEEL